MFRRESARSCIKFKCDPIPKMISPHPWDTKKPVAKFCRQAGLYERKTIVGYINIGKKRVKRGQWDRKERKLGAGLAGWYCRAGCGTSSHFGDEISLSNPAPCFICPSVRESFPQLCSNFVCGYTTAALLSIIHNRLSHSRDSLLNPLTRVGGKDVGLPWKLLFLFTVRFIIRRAFACNRKCHFSW